MPLLQYLKSLLGFPNKSQHRPINPEAEQDEIYPLHFLDQLSTARVIILSETIVFRSVLDPDKLRTSLTNLITQNGDWRKLGGRLRRKPDGSLEIHVPREFDAQARPAVGWSSKVFEVAIEEHPLGSQLPTALAPGDNDGVRPRLYPGPTTFDSFTGDGASTLGEFLCTDAPILSVHVTNFTNATVVVLVWPHAVAGALGVREILSAWSDSLSSLFNPKPGNNEGVEVPELLGAKKDILDGIVAAATQSDASAVPEYALKGREVKGWGLVKFMARMLWTVFWRPKIDNRAICLPREFVERLRRDCLRELQQQTREQTGHQGLFLSEGDVLLAWCSRFVAQARGGRKQQRPGLIFQPLDITGRLDVFSNKNDDTAEGGKKKKGGVYVQNLVGAMYTHVDPATFLHKPLGQLAQAIRSSIQVLTPEGQVRAQLRIFRRLGHTKPESLYGDPSSQLVAFSNWTKFNLFPCIDFSPALISSSSQSSANYSSSTSGGGGNDNEAGRPAYMHCQSLGENRFLRDCFAITGKDLKGNYWITAFLYPEDWDLLEGYIEETCRRI